MSRRIIPDANTTTLCRLDGDLTDHGPNGLAVTNYGSTVVPVTGMPFTHARKFVRASSQRLEIARDPSWETPSFSFGAWFKLNSIGNNMAIMDCYGPSTWGHWIHVTTGHLEAMGNTANGPWSSTIISTTTTSTGVWHRAEAVAQDG